MAMRKIQFYLLVTFLAYFPLSGFVRETYAQNKLNLTQMGLIGKVDERYQSFNVEMCEVIGGDFWIPYELIDSVRKHSNKKGIDALKWKIEPINLSQKKLRNLAAALGPTYVRVSGTWANAVYFQDNDEAKLASPPAGFKNILTRQQWKGVVDFCKAVDGKLISITIRRFFFPYHLISIDYLLAFFAFADVGFQVNSLFKGHPIRQSVTFFGSGAPQHQCIDSRIRNVVPTQRTHHLPRHLLGMPRLAPGEITLFQIG